MVAKNRESKLIALGDEQGEFSDYENEVAEPLDDMERIHNMLGKTSGAIKVSLYRSNSENRKLVYVCPLDVADFSLEEIRLKAGGGEFVVRAYDERGKLCVNEHISIEGAPIVQSAPPAFAGRDMTPAPGVDMHAMMQLMREQSRTLLDGLVQVIAPLLQKENGGASRMDMLNEMSMMKTLFSQPDTGGASNSVALLMQGIELAKSITPREGDVGGMEVLQDAIRSFAPVVQDIMKSKKAQPTAPLQLAGRAPGAQPHPQPQTQLNGDDMGIMFKFYLGKLIKFASEGRDQSLYADLIADNVPEADILRLLQAPDAVAELAKVDEGVLHHRPWFESLISELRGIFELTEPSNADTVQENSLPESYNDVLPDPDNHAINGNS